MNAGRHALPIRLPGCSILSMLLVCFILTALAVANDSHLGLQAAVYTSSLKRAFRYVDNLRVGNVVVNDSTDYWEAHEPFGGASGTQSGWGRIGGRYTMLDMSDLKTVVLDVGGLD